MMVRTENGELESNYHVQWIMFFLYVKNQSQFYNQVKDFATEQQSLPLFIFSKNFIFISRFGRLKKLLIFKKF